MKVLAAIACLLVCGRVWGDDRHLVVETPRGEVEVIYSVAIASPETMKRIERELGRGAWRVTERGDFDGARGDFDGARDTDRQSESLPELAAMLVALERRESIAEPR